MSEAFKATTTQRALIDVTRRLDIVRGYRYQDTEYAVLAGELLPAAREIAGEVVALVERVHHHYTSGDREISPAEVLARSGHGEGAAATSIPDICAVGTAEIGERLERLAEVEDRKDELVLITAAFATLGSLRRLTIVLENAIASREGLTAALSTQDDVERALAIRRAYVEFRRALRPAEPPEPGQLAARLRESAERIAELFGADIYASLRAGDRIQIHRLQDRLLAWIGGAARFDPERGRELWDDLATYVELLGQVNHRLELIEHDRAMIAEARRELASDDVRQAPEVLLELLATIYGRDDGVDRLLDAGATAVEPWRTVLEVVSQHLGTGEAGEDGELVGEDELV